MGLLRLCLAMTDGALDLKKQEIASPSARTDWKRNRDIDDIVADAILACLYSSDLSNGLVLDRD